MKVVGYGLAAILAVCCVVSLAGVVLAPDGKHLHLLNAVWCAGMLTAVMAMIGELS